MKSAPSLAIVVLDQTFVHRMFASLAATASPIVIPDSVHNGPRAPLALSTCAARRWGARRPCNAFFPEQIPRGVYSIINFAFATIDPQTFEVLPATPEDIPLYKRLTALKKDDPTLRIYIAIGGWTFNDPGPTATVFSDIARSEANQKKFIKSLIAFLNKYDMDGVDLDWEYPEAPDRSGRPEDFKNFPKFMENLSKELQQTAGRGGLSITLPASFWYLQHFDLVKLKKSVDFFNIMSYDLHGTWDKGTNLHSI
ncbi:glycoside hydrolase family 18 protein [Alternaria alternata]|nr:glycoside hydrolase family 18 protein [Alternaria alternata]